jgi:dihydrodipicolinate synthase/N-acetylneuraminate lyase
MFCETNPVPCKAAGAMMGKWKNNLRMPMLPMTKANEPKLQAALKAAKLM